MKALTISQPFASLIASGEKWVENRRWFTQFRGRLAIHAGKGTQYMTLDEMRREGLPIGAVVATAQLVACVNLEDLRERPNSPILVAPGIRVQDVLDHKHAEGPWCWVLADVQPLAEPVPARGAQGIWDWVEGR